MRPLGSPFAVKRAGYHTHTAYGSAKLALSSEPSAERQSGVHKRIRIFPEQIGKCCYDRLRAVLAGVKIFFCDFFSVHIMSPEVKKGFNDNLTVKKYENADSF